MDECKAWSNLVEPGYIFYRCFLKNIIPFVTKTLKVAFMCFWGPYIILQNSVWRHVSWFRWYALLVLKASLFQCVCGALLIFNSCLKWKVELASRNMNISRMKQVEYIWLLNVFFLPFCVTWLLWVVLLIYWLDLFLLVF